MFYYLKSHLRLKKKSTVLIHIGKCGGRTLKNGLKDHKQNSDMYIFHIKKPIYRKDLKYIIVARAPITRLISAFNWRYKLVVSDGTQRDKYRGEYEVLVKYGCLNKLAEALYFKDNTPNVHAHREIRRIHHIAEDISFYLSDLLRKCRPEQIKAVLMQESLNEDIYRVFGYKNELREHSTPLDIKNNHLSKIGLMNLKRFFIKDYEALTKLYCWGKIKQDVFIKAIQ